MGRGRGREKATNDDAGLWHVMCVRKGKREREREREDTFILINQSHFVYYSFVENCHKM